MMTDWKVWQNGAWADQDLRVELKATEELNGAFFAARRKVEAAEELRRAKAAEAKEQAAEQERVKAAEELNREEERKRAEEQAEEEMMRAEAEDKRVKAEDEKKLQAAFKELGQLPTTAASSCAESSEPRFLLDAAPYLSFIDKLRSVGVGDDVPLPQIAVVGAVSGKIQPTRAPHGGPVSWLVHSNRHSHHHASWQRVQRAVLCLGSRIRERARLARSCRGCD